MKRIIPKSKYWWINWAAFGVILLGLLWYFRPWFHGFVMGVYRNPLMLELIVLWVVLHFTYFRRKGSGVVVNTLTGPKTVKFSMGSILMLVLLLFISPIFSNIAPQLDVVNSLHYTKISDLPETKNNIRLMPYEVASRYSKDSLQLSQFRLGTENIANIDGKLSWMFPLVPDGSILSLIKENKGIVVVDATSQAKSTKMVWKDLSVGEGMQIRDNLWWNIFKTRYFIDTDDPFYIPVGDEIYTVVSLIKYSYKQFFGLFYAVPEFGGVALIDSAGNIEVLTPEQAQTNAVLKDNRLFPESLARYYGEAYVYHKGLMNKWFIHEDQIDIQDVPGTTSRRNYQPYLMDTEEGLKWFISAEPYGQSHGIFKIFIVDAADGEIGMYELPIDDTLTGPIKARDFIRQSNPVVDWNRFSIIEPLPFIMDDALYWKVVVAPSDAAGIAYQAFVNAKTNKVTEIKDNEDISRFITGNLDLNSLNESEPIIVETVRDKRDKDAIIADIKDKMSDVDALLKELEAEESD
ncbi:hypothetical protein COV93_07355 [Candidatus Woesearchaeota archaeon CG11_big_fil_rev_8_21_14_0_20_43_8]|nr:MAG: hypothetical protein COV93_07355 [Candidatus Woesearchaeota archaeon CG11_big_fil_rev_8_21_14_0_20_43_8]PIO08830.1 MAG: hypothetical protein COT47_00990 [Candidatus Woesearchaeota archaeon CG08_land_8_20_14_0_20_43_7]